MFYIQLHVCNMYESMDVWTHEPELLFTHRLKLGFVHPPLPDDTDVRLIVFRSFYAFRHRFHRVDTSSTAANATTQTDLLLRGPC
jgi:hypothetical protein